MNNKLCIACKKTIHPDANYCPECSSFQAGWKNTLRYIATISAALSLFIAALFYIVENTYEGYIAIAWEDEIKVLSLKSTDGITIANIGDGNIYISHLNYKSLPIASMVTEDIGFQSNRRIDSVLPKGQVLRYELSETIPYPYDIVHSKSDSEWRELLQRAYKTKDKCVSRIIYLRDGPSLSLLKSSVGINLNTFKAEADLYYYSIEKGKNMKHTIPVVGAVGVSYAEECIKNK